ncbi:glycosyltransferase [Roseivirga misakiensis]|uniref:Glycosyltransferase 2-like domain-containing protein n=1 Tax=Roseivirga misakiensis TaxID=1563681 RepID=A0A1E5T113_9BACT|nr:glycosyltransferase [Roseivirga misakiensis]OEK05051.1 hypothetical protein BFP71_16665 [Roseivirga misakiensis]
MTTLLLIIFISLLLIQVYFFVRFDWAIKSNNKDAGDHKPSVSVIVAARNEAENLPKLLELLVKQDHPEFEIIIINDRSNDDTKLIVESYSAVIEKVRLINIEELPSHWTGKKHAIYQGIQKARNEILLFTDADCLPYSNRWISHMSGPFSKGVDIVLGLSPYQKRKGFLNQFIQFETLFVALQYVGFTKLGNPYMGIGRNMAVRKAKYNLAWLESNAHLEGGDDDLIVNKLARKGNTAVVTQKEGQTCSIPETKWSAYFKQKTRHLSAGQYYQKKDRTLLAVFTLSILFGWLLFLSLLVSAINPYFILTAFTLRSLSFYIIFARIGRKFGSPVNLWAIPLLDLCYSIYYPITGLKALLTKNIQWK